MFLLFHSIHCYSVAFCLMFWSAVFFLIKLKYWCSYLTFNFWTRKVKRKLENSGWRGSQEIRERTTLKEFFACCIVTGSHWTVFYMLALRRCPNQQNFDFDVEEWGISKGSNKSTVLVCSPLNFFPWIFQILWDVIKAILLHLQMCWLCSRTNKSGDNSHW